MFFKTSMDMESDFFIIYYPANTKDYMYIAVEIFVSFTYFFPI